MKNFLLMLMLFVPVISAAAIDKVERWDVFEIELKGPETGNPFTDVWVRAIFSRGETQRAAEGFYDGEGIYRVRFMPEITGTWRYVTKSNVPALNDQKGEFTCVPATGDNHGPVRVAYTYHFVYADGTPYRPVGTTGYGWAQQPEEQQNLTLKTLSGSPFNKIRMMVLPHAPSGETISCYPFMGDPELKQWDFTRFNPEYFQHLERRISDLLDRGIIADLVLFHPYDRNVWGFDRMTADEKDLYLRYLIARLGVYRNVWWSLANEYDFLHWPEKEWDRLFQFIREHDFYEHPRSIHNGSKWYDHSKSWVTHASLQSNNLSGGKGFRDSYGKPVIFDEICYEGSHMEPTLNLSAREMVYRFWQGTVNGCYVTHGEAIDQQFFRRGGVFHGESVKRIAFLRRILEDSPPKGLDPRAPNWMWWNVAAGQEGRYYLLYFGPHNTSQWQLPEGGLWQVAVIDPWEMTITQPETTFAGGTVVDLPGKPHMALRLRRIK